MKDKEACFCRDCVPTGAKIKRWRLCGRYVCPRCKAPKAGEGYVLDIKWATAEVSSFTVPKPYED